MFENRVLRRMFGLKRDEMTEGKRKLHKDEFHNLYSSPNDIRMMRLRAVMDGDVERMREMQNAYKILVGKSKGKRQLGRSRSTWKNIRKCLKEIGWDSLDWIHLAKDRDRWRALVNTVMNFRVP
jgi:hypothetical protein